MAKINWLKQDTNDFGSVLDVEVNGKHNKATYHLEGNGEMIVFGKDLKIQGGELVSGKITKVVYENSDGDNCIVATNLHVSAGKFGAAAAAGGGEQAFYTLFGGNDIYHGSADNDYTLDGRRGDDKIFGGDGSEYLIGGRGDDILKGGGDSDYFAFFTSDGRGHDVIRDLQIDGPEIDALLIEQDILQTKSVHGGHDTLLKLEGGSTILIEDVTRSDFLVYYAGDMP